MATFAAQMTTYHNFIDGSWVPSVSGDVFENRNPANTDDLIGVFQKSTRADAEHAIEAARRAYAHWRHRPCRGAPNCCFSAAQLIAERKTRSPVT
jgi:aldehyde dehydrogenase (NAD+)